MGLKYARGNVKDMEIKKHCCSCCVEPMVRKNVKTDFVAHITWPLRYLEKQDKVENIFKQYFHF